MLAKLRSDVLSEGKFVTNVATIIAGTAFSQLIALLAMPILVRIYSPENFGVAATFVMLANNLSMLACLQYQGAIILPRRNETAFSLWIGCLCLALVIAIVCGGLVALFGDSVAEKLGSPLLASWLWLIPISVFACGGFEASAIWNTRLKNFKNISVGTVQRRLGMTGVQLAMGGVARSEGGLITGQVSGELLGFVALTRRGMRAAPASQWRHVNWRIFKVLLYRYRRFPQYSLFSSVASALARNMPVLVLGIYFNPAIVGFFALAHRGLVGPLQIGVTSITRVFFERANRARLGGNLAELTLRAYRRLVIVVLTPLSMLILVAPDLVVLILGTDWQQTGIYVRWLCIWLFFMATASPLHRLFVILERQNELALINGALFIFSTAALVAGGETGDPILTVAIYSMTAAAVWLAQGVRILMIAGVRLHDAMREIAREAIRTIPYVVALALVIATTDNIYLRSASFVALLAAFAMLRVRHVVGAEG